MALIQKLSAGWNVYRTPIAVWTVNFVLFVVGSLVLYPISVEVCKKAADNAQPDCSSQHIGLFLIRKIGEAISDSTFIFALITTVATGVMAYFTIILAQIGRRQIDDTKILQRAYLT